jgi:hypothetical protein
VTSAALLITAALTTPEGEATLGEPAIPEEATMPEDPVTAEDPAMAEARARAWGRRAAPRGSTAAMRAISEDKARQARKLEPLRSR